MPTYNQTPSNTLVLSQNLSRMINLNLSLNHNLFLVQNCNGDYTQYLNVYGSLSEANNYFDNRLRSVAWKRANKQDKMSALTEATGMIDRLNFAGMKTDPTQSHQFPRAPEVLPTQIIINESGIPISQILTQNPPDTVIPDGIKKACFEIALKLIQGYDPDKEVDLLFTESQSYSGVRTSYNRDYIPDYMRAGIPSFKAWSYLKPFLRDVEEINFIRV